MQNSLHGIISALKIIILLSKLLNFRLELFRIKLLIMVSMLLRVGAGEAKGQKNDGLHFKIYSIKKCTFYYK